MLANCENCSIKFLGTKFKAVYLEVLILFIVNSFFLSRLLQHLVILFLLLRSSALMNKFKPSNTLKDLRWDPDKPEISACKFYYFRLLMKFKYIITGYIRIFIKGIIGKI